MKNKLQSFLLNSNRFLRLKKYKHRPSDYKYCQTSNHSEVGASICLPAYKLMTHSQVIGIPDSWPV